MSDQAAQQWYEAWGSALKEAENAEAARDELAWMLEAVLDDYESYAPVLPRRPIVAEARSFLAGISHLRRERWKDPEVVERGAKALAEHRTKLDIGMDDTPWLAVTDDTRELYRAEARSVLRACLGFEEEETDG